LHERTAGGSAAAGALRDNQLRCITRRRERTFVAACSIAIGQCAVEVELVVVARLVTVARVGCCFVGWLPWRRLIGWLPRRGLVIELML